MNHSRACATRSISMFPATADSPYGPKPEFVGLKRLLQRKQDNRLKVECPKSYEDVDVLELLDGIRMDKLPGWANEARCFPGATRRLASRDSHLSGLVCRVQRRQKGFRIVLSAAERRTP